MTDTIRLATASAYGTRTINIDLTAGTLHEADRLHPLTDDEVARLRVVAARLHDGGSWEAREQFASGEERWTLCLSGKTVTIRYESEGQQHPALAAIWACLLAIRERTAL